MAFVLALLLFGIVQSKLPTDADLARMVGKTIQSHVRPAHLQVVVSRHSPFTTTVQHLDITMSGFTLDGLPGFQGAAVASKPPAAGTGGLQHVAEADAPSAAPCTVACPYLVRPSGRQIRVKDACISCRDFVLQSLPVQEVVVHVHELRIPLKSVLRGPFAISGVESVVGSVTLPQQGLTEFVRMRKLPLDNPQVFVTPEGCRITGVYRAGLLSVPVEVSGRIVVKDRAILCLENPRVKTMNVTLPHFITDGLLKGVNPLVDLNAEFPLPAPVTITLVTHASGCLRLDAVLHVPPLE